MKKKKVLRLIFVTDTHHTMRNPENRIDNLFDTTMLKMEEVYNIVENEEPKVESILLHGGDVFDSPDISDTVGGIIGKHYSKYHKVIALAGNHDTRGNNLPTLSQTKLGLLDTLGILQVIKPYEKIIIDKEGVSVQITGSSSDFGITKDIDKFVIKEKEADISIHLVHAMLVSQNPKFGSYMPLQNIQKLTKADITLSGDFHLGFDPVEEDGKVFINPGSIVRRSNFLEEINRKPKVAIINVYNDKTFDYELRELNIAKEGSLVLDRTKIEIKQFYDEKLQEYTNSLSFKERESYNVDIEDVIEQIASQDKVEDDILQLAILKIHEAKKMLDSKNLLEIN